ncbi:type II toxin-antitoxin system RelE/ParE family toxin [Oxalobacteraceae bacterium]|nr:type II toxin-antitoxin system RelE/ParE family toxin [Oxalobacteraceae bacterium]
MNTVKPLPEFSLWLNQLNDKAALGAILARIKRLEFGLMGDYASVGDGVLELRIHIGAGWRIYIKQHGTQVIVLLAGGSKRTQRADIKRAKALAAQLN